MINSRFIGRGFGFPMRVNATGGIAMVTDHQELEESMRLILGTAIGERPMRPEFGCRIHDRLFDSINSSTFATVEEDVQDAIRMWDPRVNVEQVIRDLECFTHRGTIALKRCARPVVGFAEYRATCAGKLQQRPGFHGLQLSDAFNVERRGVI